MRGVVGIGAGIAAGTLLACSASGLFECSSDMQCVDGGRSGVCQADGACSFPDPGCASGQRYGAHAPDSLAGTCVPEGVASTSGQPGSSGSSSAATSAGATTNAITTTVATSLPIDTTAAVDSSSSLGHGNSSSTGPGIDTDLLLWFTFEDVGGATSANSGVLATDAECAPGECPLATPGAVGTAALFDGIDDVLRVPFTPELNTTAAFTIAAWIRADDLSGDQNLQSPFTKAYGDALLDSWELFIRQLDADPPLDLVFGIISNEPMGFLGVDIEIEGEWTHVAGSYDGVTARLYVDGQPAGQADYMAPLYDDHDVLIGADSNAGGTVGHFTGAVDEARLYSRVLTNAEVASLAAR